MNDLIVCDRVRKEFPNVVAVDGLSLRIGKGEIFGLVGPDGAGKTTLIRMICGILPQTAGTIEVLKARMPDGAMSVVSEIGYMSQRFSLYSDLTVDENIEFFADVHQISRAECKSKSEELLHASRMEPFRKRMAGNLSGGMKQKLALVCTLIHTPKLLLLDEPTTGVDPISRREFWQILYDLVADGMTLLVSTPYMDEADRCERLALIDRGHLLACDTPANIRRSMKKSILEIRTSDPVAARSVLSKMDGVLSVEAFGSRLHATLRSEAVSRQIQMALQDGGPSVSEVRSVAPSLEDAFIDVLEVQSNGA